MIREKYEELPFRVQDKDEAKARAELECTCPNGPSKPNSELAKLDWTRHWPGFGGIPLFVRKD
jgi:hypothetical protein